MTSLNAINPSAFSPHTSSLIPQPSAITHLPSYLFHQTSIGQHEQTKKQAQQKMVEDSLTRAFDELHAGKAHRDARKLFK